jgi:hypothetical protein
MILIGVMLVGQLTGISLFGLYITPLLRLFGFALTGRPLA